ncbi:hypothetical protein [Streptomyces sp. NBC_01794]|nr:hypothetical protein OIE54_22265 [Streptomyces sp. NBC_01794]
MNGTGGAARPRQTAMATPAAVAATAVPLRRAGAEANVKEEA